MSPRDLSSITDAEIDAEITQLRNVAATSLDPCLTAKLIAMSDANVRVLFTQKCLAGYPFVAVKCLDQLSVPELRYVYFEFDCKPGTICLVPPSFLVTVDLTTSSVVPPIRDGYTPPSQESKRCECQSACYDDVDVAGDPISDLAGIISNVLGQPVTCAIVLNRCGNTGRCNEAFRKLRNFNNDPSAARARELADWIGASSMQEKCMKAIINTAGTVQYAIFLAAVIAAAAA